MRFVHLAPEPLRRTIERAGVHGAPFALTVTGGTRTIERAVFAMPVIADFWSTYQWLRELRQLHGARMIAVHFRVPDDEPVWVGRFGQPHEQMTASASAAWVKTQPSGAEVVVPRAISRKEVQRVVEPKQLVGWTETPDAAKKLDCVCPACLGRGTPHFMRRVRGAFNEAVTELRRAATPEEIVQALHRTEIPLERARGRIDPRRILSTARHPSPKVRATLANRLGLVRFEQCEAVLRALATDEDREVRTEAVTSIVRCIGAQRALSALQATGASTLELLPEILRWQGDLAATIPVLSWLSRHPESAVRSEALRVARDLADDEDLDAATKADLSKIT